MPISRFSTFIFLMLLTSGCARDIAMRDKSDTAKVKVEAKPKPDREKVQAPRMAAQNQSIAQLENAVRARINGERQKQGLQPLEINADLVQIARAYSRRMAQEKFFSHYDAQGNSAADRVRAAEVAYTVVGENLFLSRNAPSALEGAIKGWMKSKDHRANILTENYRQTGVGIWKSRRTYYFTQIFIQPF